MTKRKVTHLFTVVALATSAPIVAASPAKPTPTTNASATEAQKPRTLPSGAPACGNVQTKGGRRTRCTATAPAPRPEPAKPAATHTAQTRSTLQKILTFFGGAGTAAARPRELRNGSPANGNVQGRMAPRAQEKPVEVPTGPRTQN